MLAQIIIPSEERRQFPRAEPPTVTTVEYQNSHGRWIPLGVLEDISAMGLRVWAPRALEITNEEIWRLRFPGEEVLPECRRLRLDIGAHDEHYMSFCVADHDDRIPEPYATQVSGITWRIELARRARAKQQMQEHGVHA